MAEVEEDGEYSKGQTEWREFYLLPNIKALLNDKRIDYKIIYEKLENKKEQFEKEIKATEEKLERIDEFFDRKEKLMKEIRELEEDIGSLGYFDLDVKTRRW